jgi:hypothetical protein
MRGVFDRPFEIFLKKRELWRESFVQSQERFEEPKVGSRPMAFGVIQGGFYTMNKKLISGLLCAGVVATMTVPALADVPAAVTEDEVVTTAVEGVAVETAAENTAVLPTLATVLSVEKTDEAVTAITVKTDVYDTLVLLPGETTVCIDTQTGDPASLFDLTEGEEIYAYIGEAATLSEPAQTNVEAVVVNLDEQKAPAHFLTAEEVNANADGSVTVLCDNGGTLVTITAEAPVTAYRTKNIVTLDDIAVGTRFFAWYDVMTMSLPAQAAADQVVVLPAAQVEETAEADVTEEPVAENEDRTVAVVVDGAETAVEARVIGGTVMVPLRALSEALGCTVTWNGTDKTAVVTQDEVTLTVALSGEVALNGETLEAAFELEQPGTIWIELDTVEQVAGVTGTLSQDTLTFQIGIEETVAAE